MIDPTSLSSYLHAIASAHSDIALLRHTLANGPTPSLDQEAHLISAAAFLKIEADLLLDSLRNVTTPQKIEATTWEDGNARWNH